MSEAIYDVLIIGAGPAGLQAAVHAVRKKATVLVLGRAESSSLTGAHIENYLCVDGVSDGAEMLRIARGQAERFGAEVWPEDVLHLGQQGDLFEIKVANGRTVAGRTVVIATGTARKKLKVPGEKELAGRGVSYCVDCDANFFRNATVAVVGNGSAAVDGALTLTRYAAKVYLVAKTLDVSRELAARLAESAVEVLDGVWPQEIAGENAVTSLALDNGRTLAVEGVFIELGSKGAMELAGTLGVMMDTETFTHIAVNRNQETNLAGVYAAGDITGHPYQMAKAVGEGCVAGWHAANFSRRQKQATPAA